MARYVWMVLAIGIVAGAWGQAETVYKNQSEAEKELQLAKNVKTGWGSHMIRRGGYAYVSDSTREYDMNGNLVSYSWDNSSSAHSGTVAAVPIGDFLREREFLYLGTSRTGSSSVLTGLVVSVQIQISAGAASPTDSVMQRSVENLVKVGVPLPAASGAKPGKLQPLTESAKRRFGARTVKARYNGEFGKVELFLFDCLADKADDTYLPATQYGASRDERLRNASALKRDFDRGGTTVISRETEIVPYGSRHVPFNGVPSEKLNLPLKR